jgi:hypothetical protein
MSESVDFTWSPQPGDWRDALRTTVPMFRWAPWFAAALAVLSVVVLLLDMPWAGVFGLVLAAVIAVMVPVQITASFRNHPLAAKSVAGSADEHSLRMTVGESARSELDWAGLPGWTETARGFVLRTGEGTGAPAYAVPHRAFRDDADRDRFRTLLTDRVGPAARRFPPRAT